MKQYFDGQYVDYLGTKDYTPSELGYLYMQGLVDATCWCTTCHRRPGEDEDDTRVRIQGSWETKSIPFAVREESQMAGRPGLTFDLFCHECEAWTSDAA